MTKDLDTLIYIAELKNIGFLIVSADDAAPPVLGYSFEGAFFLDSIEGGMRYILEKYLNEIFYLRKNRIDATDKIKDEWKEYLSEDLFKSKAVINTSCSPLIQTSWHQGFIDNSQSSSYNRYCPSGCYAGCTAVVMAQILNFWKDKVSQMGSNTNEGNTINFGEEHYCWSYMSNSTSNTYNSKLVYHAGMSCNMDYCVIGGNGQSLGWVDDARDGFVDFWGMDDSADKKWRIYHLQTWEQDLKDELDNSRPVLYSGGNIGLSHHTWVIDGYDTSGRFHCNWGFKYTSPGYYYLGDFNPGGLNLNEFEHAIFELYPSIDFLSEIIGPAQLTSYSDE